MVKFPDIDKFTEILDGLCEELPEVFFERLNGGVNVIENAKQHPKAVDGRLYILGEYIRSREMGRYIAIYYGSFEKLFGDYSIKKLTDELRKTLRHEFRHHLEALAGEKDLEIEDDRRLERYLSSSREVFRIKERYTLYAKYDDEDDVI